MGPGYTLWLSNSSENRLPLRWISLLYQQEIGYLAASTGIRTGADALKMILSGASATQLCSILLQRGIPWLKKIEGELHQWMDTCKITSLREVRGMLSHRCMENPGQIEREEYRKALQGYARIDVPSWHDEVPIHAESHFSSHTI
jgi:dihydroorotate dehydrogenase (fumarate)